MVTKYHKSAARILDRDCINRGGLYLSEEVLWGSVYQRAADLPAVKVGGQKNFYRAAWFEPALPAPGRSADIFFKPPTLMAGSYASL